jgi:hypothetical protein
MPTIFDSHNLRMAAQRIAAAADDDAITIADARAMHKHLASRLTSRPPAPRRAALPSSTRRCQTRPSSLPRRHRRAPCPAGRCQTRKRHQGNLACLRSRFDVATCRPNYATNLQALTDGTRTGS